MRVAILALALLVGCRPVDPPPGSMQDPECVKKAQIAYDNATFAQHTHNGAVFFGWFWMRKTESADNPASSRGVERIIGECNEAKLFGK